MDIKRKNSKGYVSLKTKMANLVPLSLEELREFVLNVVETLKDKPLAPKISEGPVLYIGDIHGFFANIRKAIKIAKERSVKTIVFLGDYADRGPQQLKCVLNVFYAFARSEGMEKEFDFMEDFWKDASDFKIVALRGNHDNMYTSCNYDFPEELEKYKEHYWKEDYGRLSTDLFDFRDLCNMYRMYSTDVDYVINLIECMYEQLPIVATTTWNTMAIHGGIPEPVHGSPGYIIKRIKKMTAPLPNTYLTSQLVRPDDPEKEFKIGLSQIVWNDARPRMENKEATFAETLRGGISRGFNDKALEEFLLDVGQKRIVRAHDALMGAMAVYWDNRLIHIFSAYPYFGQIAKLAYFLEFDDGSGEFVDGNGNTIKKVDPAKAI